MPAEWMPHAATWLAWPHDPVTWPGHVADAEEVFWQMIRALAPNERVELLVKDLAIERKVQARMTTDNVSNVRLHRIPTADSWIRDYGPTFLKGPGDATACVDWIFNAWGNKYDTLLPDDGIPPQLDAIHGARRFEYPIVMEGGSIEVNGAGTVLTTEQCLLNKNRNPKLSRAEIEATLQETLGVDQVLWLHEGIVGDDTDGHIDDLARFADERTILAAVETDRKDENFPILRDNLERLRTFKDAKGRPFKIVKLPMPGPIGDAEGRLPASYANFYIANETVLAPIFGHKNDAKALKILESAFATRRIVPVRCEHLVLGMGTIHCVTQQQPA